MFARLTADFPKANNGLAPVADLGLPLEAGTRYLVEGTFFVETSSVNGCKIDLAGGDVTIAEMRATVDAFGLNSSGGTGFVRGVFDTLMDLFGNNKVISGACIPVSVRGIVQTNAAGTLVPRFAQHSTNATPVKMLKDSYWNVTLVA